MRKVRLGNKWVGDNTQCLIIAEAGVNFNNSPARAMELIRAAAKAGADVVKFQTGVPSEGITKEAVMADYQVQNTGKTESQYEMSMRISLELSAYSKIYDYCCNQDIIFASTSFASPGI